MLQHDLKSAGIPYVDPDGHYADFHALRNTIITNLMKNGVNPKTPQSLARHSTIELTLNVYTSLTVHDQAAALASLPAPPVFLAEAVLKATGTDGPRMARIGPAGSRTRLHSEWPPAATAEKFTIIKQAWEKGQFSQLDAAVCIELRSGEGEIRTRGTREGTPVFKTGARFTQG